MMDIYITFYHRDYKMVHVNNGFSFGREKQKEDIDIFIDENGSFVEIAEYIIKNRPKRIWCSVSNKESFEIIRPILNTNWIVGGPYIQLRRRELSQMNFPCEFVYTTIEEYLGKSLSTDYDFYFEELIDKFPSARFRFNCPLSVGGCYWGKCSFCRDQAYTSRDMTAYHRCDIEKIMKTLRSGRFQYHTCVSSIDAHLLSDIVKYNISRIKIITYVRSDKSIINCINNFDSLEPIVFSLGLEGFSQVILDKLVKGMTIENTFDFIHDVLERNGWVSLSLIEGFTFLNEDILKECESNIIKLELLRNKINRGGISWNGPRMLTWPIKKMAESEGIESMATMSHLGKNYYRSEISRDHIQYLYNKKLIEMWEQSSIPRDWIADKYDSRYF